MSTDRGAPAVEFRGVSFRYPGAGSESPALQDVSLVVRQGELLGIVGPNGGGKSTLLKLLLGLLKAQNGSISVGGYTPSEARRRRIVGYVPQRSEALRSFPINVFQAVQLAATIGLSPMRLTPRSIKEDVERAIEFVGLGPRARTPIGRLSGGQFQRMLIARALATSPSVLALDEPTVGIDPSGRQRFSDLIRRLHRDMGLSILIVSHDVRAIATGADHCDRVACLSRNLHFHDAPMGLTPQVLAEVFSHDLVEAFGQVHIDAHGAHDCGGDHASDSHASLDSGWSDPS